MTPSEKLAELLAHTGHYPGTELVLRYEVKPHSGTAQTISPCQES